MKPNCFSLKPLTKLLADSARSMAIVATSFFGSGLRRQEYSFKFERLCWRIFKGTWDAFWRVWNCWMVFFLVRKFQHSYTPKSAIFKTQPLYSCCSVREEGRLCVFPRPIKALYAELIFISICALRFSFQSKNMPSQRTTSDGCLAVLFFRC